MMKMKNMFKLMMEQEKCLSPEDELSHMLRDVLGDELIDDDIDDAELELAIGAAKKNNAPRRTDLLDD